MKSLPHILRSPHAQATSRRCQACRSEQVQRQHRSSTPFLYCLSVQRELADIPGADAAVAFLSEAYRTRLRRPGRTVEHPIAVATLLAKEGQPSRVVVAGILHDILEDTDASSDELDTTFGAEITRLVGALTQDSAIKKYRTRKLALRQRIIDAGPEAASVSLADKAAKLRSVRARPTERKLEHYRETLRGIEQRYGSSHLSGLLREQLDRWPEQ